MASNAVLLCTVDSCLFCLVLHVTDSFSVRVLVLKMQGFSACISPVLALRQLTLYYCRLCCMGDSCLQMNLQYTLLCHLNGLIIVLIIQKATVEHDSYICAGHD